MLGGQQPHLGQVKDLPGLHPSDRRQRQIPTAALARHRPVDHDLVRVRHLGQVRARRAGLLAGPATVVTPLLPGRRRLAKPVRRRRLGGVARVPAELALQRRHLRPQRLNHLGLLGEHAGLLGVGPAQLSDHHRLDSDGRLQISSRIGEQLGLRHSSGHARLPMGPRESYPTTLTKSTSPPPDPRAE